MADRDPKSALETHRTRLMKIPGVVGVSFGISPAHPGKRCILVHATTEGWPPDLPHELNGFEVELVKVPGGFRALGSP
jgi:hypothetical protein